MRASLILGLFSLVLCTLPCRYKDIQCGECCCWVSGSLSFSVGCSDRGLINIPYIGRLEAHVDVLALQRNAIGIIYTGPLITRFPKLRLLDVSKQQSNRPVTLIGQPLPSRVQIIGE